MPKKIESIRLDLEGEIDALFDDLESEELSKVDFESAMLGLLSAYIAAAFMAGAETEDVTPETIAPLVEFQAGYLAAFVTTMLAAEGINPAWRSRARSYAGAVVPAFWRGKNSGLVLPAYPGEGSECMQNCKCAWNIVRDAYGYDCYWELGYAEHCPTCVERNREWYPWRIDL